MKAFILILYFSVVSAGSYEPREKDKKRKTPRTEIAYLPRVDGIPCDEADWVSSAVQYPILVTNQGNVKGAHRCKLNRRYANPKVTEGMGPAHFEGDSFYNVPYAKHVRRFDYAAWSVSGNYNGREDCLNLNLFIPGSISQAIASDEKLPVVLFLHGGDYSYGSADGGGTFDTYWYDGLMMGSYGNYIYASINYRMHSFGFLSTEDEHARGNYAVDDVMNAINWVWDNADAIGADRSRITLMGQSSGAALAHDVAITPQMKGKLFNVIPLSGSAVSYWGYWNHTQSVRNARELASGAHCNYADTGELVECLRQLPPEELTVLRLHRNDTWRPVVESQYFPGTAEELVKQNHDFNLFISSVPDDGYEYIFSETWDHDDKEARFRQHIREVTVPYDDTYGKMPFLEEVFFHAFFPYDNLEWFDFNAFADWQNVSRYIDTDVSYENGVFKGAKLHVEAGGTAYYYGLNGPSSEAENSEETPAWLRFVHGYYFGHGLLQRNEWHDGILGGNDCPNGNPGSCNFTPTQIDFSEYAMHLLSNIAHTGNAQLPRPVPTYLNVAEQSDWIPYAEETKIKNVAYMDTNSATTLEQRAETVPDHRLNNFYLFNDLVDDLEVDRKEHCEVGTYSKRSIDKDIVKTASSAGIFGNAIHFTTRAECGASNDLAVATLSTTGGCLQGEVTSLGQQYRSVTFATQQRFEPSILFSSSDNIETSLDRKLCPHADSSGNISENKGTDF